MTEQDQQPSRPPYEAPRLTAYGLLEVDTAAGQAGPQADLFLNKLSY